MHEARRTSAVCKSYPEHASGAANPFLILLTNVGSRSGLHQLLTVTLVPF